MPQPLAFFNILLVYTLTDLSATKRQRFEMSSSSNTKEQARGALSMLLKPLLTAGVFWYIVHGPNGHSDHPSSLCHQSGLSEAQFQALLVAADLAYIEGDVKI